MTANGRIMLIDRLAAELDLHHDPDELISEIRGGLGALYPRELSDLAWDLIVVRWWVITQPADAARPLVAAMVARLTVCQCGAASRRVRGWLP